MENQPETIMKIEDNDSQMMMIFLISPHFSLWHDNFWKKLHVDLLRKPAWINLFPRLRAFWSPVAERSIS